MSSVDQLNKASAEITLSISVICMLLGTIGLLLNLAILTRRSLRSNSCSMYFLAATCTNLFVVFIIFPFRILVGTFNNDPTIYNEPLCKIQIYIFSVVRALAIWFIALACIDRYFCSSFNATFRALSSIKVARRVIFSCTVLLFVVYIHDLIYFGIDLAPDQYGRLSPTCIGQRGFYRTFAPLWNLVWYALLPSFLMLLFGLLTIKNIRQSHRQILPENQQNQRHIRRNRTNNQLLKMLFVQVITIVLTISPFIICRLRASFISNNNKSQYEIAQENFFLQTATVISLISHAISFYLFTLSGTIFRHELRKILSNCEDKITYDDLIRVIKFLLDKNPVDEVILQEEQDETERWVQYGKKIASLVKQGVTIDTQLNQQLMEEYNISSQE